MIKVIVKTTNIRNKEVVADVTGTPKSGFDELGASVAGASVNLNGTILTATDLNSTFEALGVADGGTINLNAVVKADGAR